MSTTTYTTERGAVRRRFFTTLDAGVADQLEALADTAGVTSSSYAARLLTEAVRRAELDAHEDWARAAVLAAIAGAEQ